MISREEISIKFHLLLGRSSANAKFAAGFEIGYIRISMSPSGVTEMKYLTGLLSSQCPFKSLLALEEGQYLFLVIVEAVPWFSLTALLSSSPWILDFQPTNRRLDSPRASVPKPHSKIRQTTPKSVQDPAYAPSPIYGTHQPPIGPENHPHMPQIGPKIISRTRSIAIP
jgi:hypothetical protein